MGVEGPVPPWPGPDRQAELRAGAGGPSGGGPAPTHRPRSQEGNHIAEKGNKTSTGPYRSCAALFEN